MPSEDVSGTLMNMASGEESPLGNLLKSGDVDKAATMAYAVLSMVDTSEGKMESDQKKSVSLLKCVRLTVSKILSAQNTSHRLHEKLVLHLSKLWKVEDLRFYGTRNFFRK